MLAKFGQDLTVRNYTNESYNPATGKNVKTYSDTTVKGAVFSFGSYTSIGGDISMELVKAGDRKALITAEVTPQLEDHLLVGEKVYVIKNAKELNPAGTSVMFVLHIRNG